MNDIELRWLTRNNDRGVIETVLQYRKSRYVINYSTILPDGTYVKDSKWSEWTDIPSVDKEQKK